MVEVEPNRVRLAVMSGAPELTMFVTSLSRDRALSNEAYSEAANQVQNEIMVDIADEVGQRNLRTISMMPVPAYPQGALIISGCADNQVRYLGYLNLPVFKHLAFAVRMLLDMQASRPGTIIIYNSYFFQNLALLLYKSLHRKVKVAVFVQDVLPITGGWKMVQRYLDRYSLRFLSKFDLVLPISEHISADFNIKTPQMVVRGGLTRNIIDSFLIPQLGTIRKKRAVFAGGLEPHNGIDRLIDAWVTQEIDIELHVFGKGSLAHFVAETSRKHSRVIFHGFAPHDHIQDFIAGSEFLFVLRYDAVIEAKYFFPSKFWEALASDATVICNIFSEFPLDLKEYCVTVDDDLADLRDAISRCKPEARQGGNSTRQDYVIKNYTWVEHVRKMLLALK